MPKVGVCIDQRSVTKHAWPKEGTVAWDVTVRGALVLHRDITLTTLHTETSHIY